MNLSRAAEKELLDLAGSDNFRKDMDTLRAGWANAFVIDGVVDADAYIEFLNHFNEFIDHEPKPFVPMIEKEMKL